MGIRKMVEPRPPRCSMTKTVRLFNIIWVRTCGCYQTQLETMATFDISGCKHLSGVCDRSLARCTATCETTVARILDAGRKERPS